MARERIPRKDSEFDQYIRNTTTALNAGMPVNTATRLGLSLPVMAQWQGYHDQWVLVYPKYTDKTTRTLSITNQKNNLKKAFITFASPLLTGFSVHPALTEDDRTVFNLPAPDSTPTARPAILTPPGVILKALPGNKVQVECRVEADQSRPSKHKDCDVVEYRYTLGSAAGSPSTPTPGPTPPSGPSAAPVTGESGKAKFIIQLTESDAGKIITISTRWKNSKENQKSGPWSAPAQIMVTW